MRSKKDGKEIVLRESELDPQKEEEKTTLSRLKGRKKAQGRHMGKKGRKEGVYSSYRDIETLFREKGLLLLERNQILI